MSETKNKYDFVISGAGLVGCLSAIILSRMGYSCCVIEKNIIATEKESNTYSPLSLNYRSILILKKFKIWDDLKKISYPIKSLTLKSFNSFSRLSLTANDLNLDSLGYVFDRHKLLKIFRNILAQKDKISVFDSSEVKIINYNKSSNDLNLIINNKNLLKEITINTKYLIASDGDKSNIKKSLHIDSEYIDYSQTSYIFNCKAKCKINEAIQIFNRYGIFAAIPFDKNKINLILTLKNSHLSSFFDNKNNVIENMVENIFSGYVSDISNYQMISQYDMKTIRSHSIFKNNVLLLGNSSQLLHPVGAQGFNLALKNIESLVDYCLKSTNDLNKAYSDNLNIDFSKSINTILFDRNLVFKNVDLAIKLFANDKIPSRFITFFVLNSIKSSQTLKKQFLKKILGLDNYSYLTVEAAQ
ncbi:MAG: FAD-dependent monooxygenase [Pelagibacterales bacterium]|nr:FAD-dependent monooxygenase [Pelagibacterales bacterium]